MSALLILHITACSLGYLSFGAGCIIAFLYLYQHMSLKKKRLKLDTGFTWSLARLDKALFFTLEAGFLTMGIGLLFGVIYQSVTHGAVELATSRLLIPLAIWLFYLAVLLIRELTGLRGKIPAQLSAYGFVFFTLSFLYELHLVT